MTRFAVRSMCAVALGLAVVCAATPASAQVVQSLQFGAGGFFPRGFDTRIAGDVLVADLSSDPALLFSVSDFRSGHVFGEWTVAFGHHVEVGAQLGYYTGTVPSIYRDLVNSDGTEIVQQLHLRIVPLSGVVRFLPFGHTGQVQPFIGAGVSALIYRYSESGQFVDSSDFSVFTARYAATGTSPGALVLYGVRVPVKGDIFAVNFEGRYGFGSGDTGGAANGFLDDKVDLSGSGFNVGFLIRF